MTLTQRKPHALPRDWASHPSPRRTPRRTVVQFDLFGPPRMTRQPFTPERLVQMAIGIWRASGPVAGTLGERFFLARRIAVPGPGAVRFHASLKHGDTRSPGLLWMLRDLRTDQPCGVLRLFLDVDGLVIGRRILGRALGATLNRAPRPP